MSEKDMDMLVSENKALKRQLEDAADTIYMLEEYICALKGEITSLFKEENYEITDKICESLRRSVEREKQEVMCAALTENPKVEMKMIKRIEDLGLLRAWLEAGLNTHDYFALQNAGINMEMAYQVAKMFKIINL